MRVVMVDKFSPWPANDGGKLRSAALLERLAAGAEVVLCAFERDDADAGAASVLGIDVRTVPLDRSAKAIIRGTLRAQSGSAGRFWHPALASVVEDALAEAPTDVLQVEHGQLAPYLAIGPARTRVLDMHNIDSELAASFARSSRSTRARLALVESQLLRRLERRAVRIADVVVTVSEADARKLPQGVGEVLVCPNGWHSHPALPLPPDPCVIFAALMGWRPNIDAAVWFTRRVWPRIRNEEPAARLLLVGRDPSSEVRDLASEDVVVTGTVPDVRPYLAKAQVAVAPLLAGGGTRLKVLEALDAGRPIVATSVGASGLEGLVGQGVVIADEPGEMASEVVGLLRDRDRSRRLGDLGHEAVAATYSWDATLRPLLDRVGAR